MKIYPKEKPVGVATGLGQRLCSSAPGEQQGVRHKPDDALAGGMPKLPIPSEFLCILPLTEGSAE